MILHSILQYLQRPEQSQWIFIKQLDKSCIVFVNPPPISEIVMEGSEVNQVIGSS